MIPHLKHVVQAVRDRGGWDFSTKAGLCAYSHAVKVAVHRVDQDFGELLKPPAKNHCVDPLGRLCAVDALLYKPTGQTVDFIGSAEPGDANTVEWTVNEDDHYPPESWVAPVDDVPTPAPSPEPAPPAPVPEPTPAPTPAPPKPSKWVQILNIVCSLWRQYQRR